jgi:hypothetical protein
MGEYKMLLSKSEALFYITGIVEERWVITRDGEVNDLLSNIDPRGRKTGKDELITLDPAAWHDWEKAIKKVTDNEKITEVQAKKAIIELMKEYNKQGYNFQNTIDHFQNVLMPLGLN